MRTPPGSTVNEWDWRAHDVYEVYIGDRGGFYVDRIQSPFRSDRLNFHPNVVHLAFELPLDYEPSDGWELLFRNFGTSSKPVQEPVFGLYNRYEGMIRVFYYMTPDEVGKAQNATLLIKHNLDASPDATSAEIGAFCASEYDAQLAKALVEKILRENLPAEKIGADEIPHETISVYPNPFIDRVTLSLPAEFHSDGADLR